MFKKTIFLLCYIAFSLFAQANETYIIDNIKIQASDKVASIARNKAIEKGQIKAFHELLDLHFPDAKSKINSITKDNIENTIDGYEIANERRSTTNYLAKLKVTFNKDQIDNLMSSLGAHYKEAKETITNEAHDYNNIPVEVTLPTINSLIIPILNQGDNFYWFDDENIWLDYWHKKLKNSTHEKFALPLADLEDLSLLNKDILNKNLIDLGPIFERYGVNNIALLTLKDKQPNFSLSIQYLNKYHQVWQNHEFKSLENEDIKTSLDQLTSEVENYNFVRNNSHNDSKNISEYSISEPDNLTVNFAINNISDWLTLEEILSNSRYISNIIIHKITLHNYQFSFTYNISFDDLESLLETHHYSLKLADENKFILVKEHD